MAVGLATIRGEQVPLVNVRQYPKFWKNLNEPLRKALESEQRRPKKRVTQRKIGRRREAALLPKTRSLLTTGYR